jgi:guanosine-3',5'-bis(diphosphate) 3'-pyrophosphohydrolase
VNNRKQIAQIIRELRMQFGFPRISRLAMPIAMNETLKAKAC